jgi:hypothetical protein
MSIGTVINYRLADIVAVSISKTFRLLPMAGGSWSSFLGLSSRDGAAVTANTLTIADEEELGDFANQHNICVLHIA